MYLPLSSKYTFLRWHYPNQVYGSKFSTSSQPVKQAPRFIYKIQYSSVGKNVNINIKIYPVIFWSLIFWSQMQVSRTNCILQECFREAVICFCNAEYGKMHKKTEHTLKNHVNVPKLREVH